MERSAVVLLVDEPAVAAETAAHLEAGPDTPRVVTASDIGEAMAVLEERRIDCVVSNYEVPDEHGIEFLGGLELLKAVRERHPDLPFILFTTIGNEDIAREAIAADVTDYILKWGEGDSYDRLADRIDAAVARREAERRAAWQAQINQVIRSVNAALVRADSQSEIERTVPEQLTAADPYDVAIVCEFEDEVRPRAAAVDGEAVDVADVPQWGDDATAVREAATEGSLQVVDDLAPDGPWGSVHAAGYRSAAVVPITFGTTRYGVLVIYAHRPDAFTETTRSVVAELGETVAYALHAVETRAKLRRQNARLEEFASVVSHDLRNPLTVARGYLSELEGEAADEVGVSLDRMEHIVDDVLDLARTEREPETTTLDLERVAREAWSQVDTGDATLVVDDVGTVEAHEGQLSRLLENCFRNAVEHGDATEVRVERVTVDRDGTPRTGFAVADDGSGIPADQRDRVLETGYTTADEGTGFGLAIVRDVAGAHGWTVSIEEGEAGGVRVVVA